MGGGVHKFLSLSRSKDCNQLEADRQCVGVGGCGRGTPLLFCWQSHARTARLIHCAKNISVWYSLYILVSVMKGIASVCCSHVLERVYKMKWCMESTHLASLYFQNNGAIILVSRLPCPHRLRVNNVAACVSGERRSWEWWQPFGKMWQFNRSVWGESGVETAIVREDGEWKTLGYHRLPLSSPL